jgi:hypothetical protein
MGLIYSICKDILIYTLTVRKCGERRPFWRCGHRWKNIEIHLSEINMLQTFMNLGKN